MKKVLFVATVVKTHIMEFHIPYLKMFKELGWETAVAAKNDYNKQEDCQIPYCDTYYDIPFERFPLKQENLKAYKMLKKIIDEGNYNIIHCHTPVGAMICRLASREVRNRGTKVYYTAHGFHFYKGAPLINWLLYYPAERMLAHYTDVLITINKEDYNRAKRFKAKKVYYVPGVGIDLKKFKTNNIDKNKKRNELGIDENDFVLLSVGELIERKNHEVVIRALGKLKKEGKLKKIKYVICGQGKLEQYLRELSRKMKVENIVLFLGYRNDIAEVCNCCDLFMFMSLQEGLPVALMEAMACGIPCVCSNIRGNTDLVEHEVTGFISENSVDILSSNIEKICADDELCKEVTVLAKEKIKNFDLINVENQMRNIYGIVEVNNEI